MTAKLVITILVIKINGVHCGNGFFERLEVFVENAAWAGALRAD